MAMQQLDLPSGGKKEKITTRLGKTKRDGEGDRRGKSPKSQQRVLLSASMEIPISSGVVLTQGDGYNPLAWDSMPAALQKQFPHWKTTSPTAKNSQEDDKGCPTDEHPFLISQKAQVLPAHGIPYVVMEGDTLNSISLKFDTTPAELARLNKRTLAGFSIFPGNVVYIPDGEEAMVSPTDTLAIKREVPRKSAPPFLNFNSPTPEREAPPPQTPPNPIKKKKLELTKSQELHSKTGLDVKPARKRTASYSARMEKAVDCLSDRTYQETETETYVSLSSKYISDDQGCVHGILTVSTTSLLFKPNQSDPLVQEHGSAQYELLIPLNDITHASITRDVALPRRQPFSSPRRQSSLRTHDIVVMEMLKSATPTKQLSIPETAENTKNDESEVVTDRETESGTPVAGEDEKMDDGKTEVTEGGSSGMERSPAPNMLDTDAESEWDSETIATPIQSSDDTALSELKRNEEDDEKSEKAEVEVAASSSDLKSHSNDDITGSNNPLNENGAESPGSTEDLLAIMGSGEPESDPATRPQAMSQCSVLSLDAALGTDTAYFLHFRVVSNSGQKYTYIPVNTMKGIDIPRGEGTKASSPPVEYVKTFFCFVVPERNLERVVSFLSLHHPQGSARLGSPSDQQRWTDGHFDVIKGPRLDQEDLSFCDDHFKNPDSWEVYSLSDIHKYRNVIHRMEVEESLPLPAMSEESMLFGKNHLKRLILHLPSQAIGHDMHLVYSTFTHGISLRTMYRNMLAFGDTPVLFVVRDDSNKLFGAMASSYLRLSDHFYGTGESCLFTFDDESLEVFPWTGLNSYFIKGNTDSIAIGSGDGHFGLWLDEEFLHGTSYNCETYGNRPLATTEDFLCTGVEAWGFGVPDS